MSVGPPSSFVAAVGRCGVNEAGSERMVSWLKQLNVSLENWILSLPDSTTEMMGKSFKRSFSHLDTNGMFFIFWVLNLRLQGPDLKKC